MEISVEREFLSALTQRRLAGVNMMCDVDGVWIATTTTMIRWRNKCTANRLSSARQCDLASTFSALSALSAHPSRFPLIHRASPFCIVHIPIATRFWTRRAIHSLSIVASKPPERVLVSFQSFHSPFLLHDNTFPCHSSLTI
jgi:hypothetical protein